MKKRIVAVAVALLLIASMIPSAFAADDTTPPVITNVSINQTEFNVGDTVVISVQCNDTESGIDYSNCLVCYKSSLEWTDLRYLRGTKTDTGFEARLTLDNTYGGLYYIESVQICDMRGNNAYASRIGGTLAASFNVINVPYPQITNLQVSTTKAKVGDTVTYTITGTDGTGVVAAGMKLYLPGASTYVSYDIPMTAVPGSDGSFSGSILITADMPDGVYYPSDVYLTGGSGLTTNANPNDMAYLFGETRLTVVNPSVSPIKVAPQLLSYSLSTHQMIAGQRLKVTAKIDPKNNKASFVAGISMKHPVTYSNRLYFSAQMTEIGSGVYVADIWIPYNCIPGEYALYFVAYDMQGNGLGFTAPDSFYKYEGDYRYFNDGDVTISPLLTVSGTDNRTLLVGDSFDPMQGVTASNAYTGDITGKITMVGGDINTSVPGLYMIKYIVNDTVSIEGLPTPVSYTDYRWIGVSEIEPAIPVGGDMPLALTDGNLAIGATSADVSIQKDGATVPFSNVVTEPGKYTLSSSASASAASAEAEDMPVLALSNEASSTVTAVIDRTGPVLTTAWGKNASKAIVVTVKASDVSGVAETRYLAGTCSVEQCKSAGTAFAGTFTVAGYGKYTVYARDRLGYESVTVYNINSASSSNSAYIENIGISAGSLSRAFSKTVYSYKVNLGENEGSVTITPVKEFEGATMTIAGKALSSYTANVANGKSVTVKVKVTYGKTSHTYTFTVTRAKSSNNNLASLSATAGSFDRAFDPNVTNYTLTLDENTKSTKITNAVAAPGFAKASPSSTNVTLSNGQSKVVKITVKAQSGAKKTYVITVTRAAATNAGLKSLKSGKFPLSPAFSAGVTNYTIALPATTGSVTISAAAAGYKAVVYIDGKKKTSQKVSVANGGSVTVHIVVVAQAGNTMDYYVTVTRP